MKSFYLVETTTKDGLVHQGAYFEPKNKGKRAILLIHGLTSTFYSDAVLLGILAEQGEAAGIGIASFNNRGHDYIASARKMDPSKETGYTHVTIGAGVEKFEDCVHDIDAGITFLKEKGFDEVVLAGFSTGANKACFYVATVNDPRVVGVILVGPLSDRLVPGEYQKKLTENIVRMEKLVAEGKGEELVTDVMFFPITPNRYISLHKAGTAEDTFDYGDAAPKLTYFKSIKQPLFVIFGEKDEYADRPVADILKVYDAHQQSKNYKSAIVPGGMHGLDGAEQKGVQLIADWIKSIK